MSDLMNVMEIAVHLKDMRQTAKRLYGDQYDKQVKPFKALLRKLMKQYGTDNAAKAILRDSQDGGGDPPLSMFAACYDVMENNNADA